ncbi:MAG: TIGR03936 family radical SAM-associated protein [Candidatus Omnitrophica bacterium]|nr:TIGR03936 family radical SAM-associated protein [Candidatus Omnitrophota bacterium]
MINKKFPLEVILEKSQEMIYFSQLDLIHLLERALRRTRLPLYFTQGFSPRVKISFKSGLKLGLAGRITTIFYFTEDIPFVVLKENLQPQLPQGLVIIK